MVKYKNMELDKIIYTSKTGTIVPVGVGEETPKIYYIGEGSSSEFINMSDEEKETCLKLLPITIEALGEDQLVFFIYIKSKDKLSVQGETIKKNYIVVDMPEEDQELIQPEEDQELIQQVIDQELIQPVIDLFTEKINE